MAQSLTQKPAAQIDRPRAHQRTVPRPRWGAWLFLLLLLGLLALGVTVGVTAHEWRYDGRIYPGVQVAGIGLDGLTLAEAEELIQGQLTPYPGEPVLLRYGEHTWSFSPEALGVTVDGRANALAAYTVGRSGAGLIRDGEWETNPAAQWQALRADLLVQWQAARTGVSLPIQLSYDDNAITFAIMRLARDIDVSPQEGSLSISGLEVIAAAGKPGRKVDVEATRAALVQAAHAGRGGEVSLVVRDTQPAITSVDEAAARADTLLSRPLTVVVQGHETVQRFGVDRAALSQWLTIRAVPVRSGKVDLAVQLDRDQVSAYLKQLAASVNRPPVDATVDFDPKTASLKVLTASRVGQELDTAVGLETIATALLGDGSHREVAVPVKLIRPRVDSEDPAALGIVELVSEGTTTFKGSSTERVHNIVTAAGKFSNVVVPPGEDFSFNKNVGDISAANGFTEGLIIAGDRTAVGIGGGVCQVSTTAFRAAYNGGFPITERHAHGYVVSWYGKPGMDATIFTPDVDFRFNNDTGRHLLVKSAVDAAKGEVTFYIYGTKPNRTVETEGPTITNVKEPPRALYQEDATLKAGTIKQVDWAAKGLDAVIVRRVKSADGTVHEDIFKSRYQPWRTIYMYAPGAKLPPGALDEDEPTTTSTP